MENTSKKRSKKRDILAEAHRHIKHIKVEAKLETASDTLPETDNQEVLRFPLIVQKNVKPVPHSGLENWLERPVTVSPYVEQTDENKIGEEIIPSIRKGLLARGITHWFPVQRSLIPLLLQTRHSSSTTSPGDICVSALTGSGKTYSYVIPILMTLHARIIPRIRALIIVPTRDLALQVRDTFETVNKKLHVGLAIGQTSFSQEQLQLVSRRKEDAFTEKGGCSKIDILVATPGRLVDHIDSTAGFSLDHLRFLVIDEADRLLNQSYHGWLEKVLKVSNQGRQYGCQKLLFSATLTRNPEKISSLQLFKPTYICVQDDDLNKRYITPPTLTEKMIISDTIDEKPLVLLKILLDESPGSVLVFCKSIEASERLTRLINIVAEASANSNSCIASMLASETSPSERRKILKNFNSRSVIVCTDMSARGLDLEVDMVVNYDAPGALKTYIHRIGRTARAGRSGTALSIIDSRQAKWFKANIVKSDKISRKNPVSKRKSEWKSEKIMQLYLKALEKLKEYYCGHNNGDEQVEIKSSDCLSDSEVSTSSESVSELSESSDVEMDVD